MSAELIEQLRTELADSILDRKDLEIQVAIARKQRDVAILQAAELRQQIDALSDGCAFCGSDAHTTQGCPMRSRGMEKGPAQLRIEAQCAAAAPVGERDAFEAWVVDGCEANRISLTRCKGSGCYVDDDIEWQWEGWQAGAAYQRGQRDAIKAQLLEALEAIVNEGGSFRFTHELHVKARAAIDAARKEGKV